MTSIIRRGLFRSRKSFIRRRFAKAADAPSNLSITGRYILQPEIFDLLAKQAAGAGGEIQLTDAMLALSKTQPFYGLKFDGRSYDCGSKIGFLTANIAYGLERPAIAPELREEMKRMLGEVWTPNNSRRSLPALYRGNRTLSSGRCRRPWGYAEFIKAIGDASHERHAEIKERLPEDFDPNKVDADWLVRERSLTSQSDGPKSQTRSVRVLPNPRPSPDAYADCNTQRDQYLSGWNLKCFLIADDSLAARSPPNCARVQVCAGLILAASSSQSPLTSPPRKFTCDILHYGEPLQITFS